jgi:hypothetical protein
MECEKCGTWNADDKIRCWRCNAELPKPPEPRKQSKINSQTWLWIIVAVFIVVTTLFRCNAFDLGDGGDGTGFSVPSPQPGTAGPTIGVVLAPSGVLSPGTLGYALPVLAGHSTIGGT